MAKIIELPTGKFQVVPSRSPDSHGPPGTPGRPPEQYGPPLGYDTRVEAEEKLRQVQFKSINRSVLIATSQQK